MKINEIQKDWHIQINTLLKTPDEIFTVQEIRKHLTVSINPESIRYYCKKRYGELIVGCRQCFGNIRAITKAKKLLMHYET